MFFLRHRHKDHAWKLYMGTHSRFKSENDLTYSVLFTNYSIQKFNCGSIYCNESVSVNRGISVLRSSLKGVFLRLYANQRSNSSVCFSLCEVNVIWNNALDACSLIYRKKLFWVQPSCHESHWYFEILHIEANVFVQTLLTRVLNKN